MTYSPDFFQFNPYQEEMKSAKCKEKMQDVFNEGSRKLRQKKRANRDSDGASAIEMYANGCIVRSAGRKDRDSKVSTTRGPRDRRVRLSPNTAIQFYDVQDMLGYDRPSKAIDWLMKEAKAAIDALDHESGYGGSFNDAMVLMNPIEKGIDGQEESSCSKAACGFHGQDEYLNDISLSTCTCGLFPVVNGVVAPSSTEIFAYPNGDLHLSSRNRAQENGLSLSFQSCQNCSFFFSNNGQEQGLIPDSTPPSHCETSSEVARFQRILDCNPNSSYIKDSQEESLIHSQQPLHYPSHYDENQIHLQREPLQSSTFLFLSHNS